jgi:hypothetical protein
MSAAGLLNNRSHKAASDRRRGEIKVSGFVLVQKNGARHQCNSTWPAWMACCNWVVVVLARVMLSLWPKLMIASP